MRVLIRLKRTAALAALVDTAFELSHTPEMDVWNNCIMTAYNASGIDKSAQIIFSTENESGGIEKDGYDSLRGYTTDTEVYPYKESRQSLADVDYENRKITIHYSARVEERSVINDRVTYEQAIADGRLLAETSGTWYDLLPKGVVPVLSSVRLRENDTLLDAYTIENYQNSGRTLLVVKADLTPVPVGYWKGDMYYMEDVPSVHFDGLYDLDSLKDYGENIHNVIAFESGNDQIGTIENYRGEPDDPYAANNIATKNAFAGNEKDLMKDLDPERDTPSFVYAGTWTKIDIISAARVELQKDVMVNRDGWWSDGLYYGQEEQNRRTVWEGGTYAYRLRMMPDSDTKFQDMIIYDSLENFQAKAGHNDDIDDGAPHWQGTLRGVDVSQLEEKGCAPVIYYSTVENLQLSNEEDPDQAKDINTDLTNSDVWIRASAYQGSLEDVRAVAIDASTAKDGGKFELKPLESVVVILNMRAPSGEQAREWIAQKGAWGDSAQAYNNAYLKGTTIDARTDEVDGKSFVRKDYTKVGLMEYRYEVKKIWDDRDDQDGIRPEEIVLTLYADGSPYIPAGSTEAMTLTIRPDETGTWEGAFENIPYTDPEGNPIRYSVKETVPEGYAAELKIDENAVILTNRHIPEKISVSGVKNWVGDTEEVRPASIQVTLYKDGTAFRTQKVTSDADGNWAYTFSNLDKYRDHGTPIVYTVGEVADAATRSYIPSVEGTDLTNTYHPYGDLIVSKTLQEGTEAAEKELFTFTFHFSKENEAGERVPVFTEYNYEIRNRNGSSVRPDDGIVTGTVSEGGTIAITAGQMITVREIEEDVVYRVEEEPKDGFQLIRTDGAEGTIAPNETKSVEFLNEYHAAGRINLQAVKLLKNRELQRYQFRFELYEVTLNEDGSEKEKLIRQTEVLGNGYITAGRTIG